MQTWSVVLALVLIVVQGGLWARRFGLLRGALAAGCRSLWVAAVLSTLFPERVLRRGDSQLDPPRLVLLRDNSRSMDGHSPAPLRRALLAACADVGCQLEEHALVPGGSRGREYSPVVQVWDEWHRSRSHARAGVVFFTDAADSTLGGSPRQGSARVPSLIVVPPQVARRNYWVGEVAAPRVVFRDRPFQLAVRLRRTASDVAEAAMIQAQVRRGSEVLAGVALEFGPGVDTLDWEPHFAGLRDPGHHALEVRILATPGEHSQADNRRLVTLTVEPNTFGVLHLLGNPSWDGRYMRQLLSSEPKFDRVSFYILRDAWDDVAADERSLSLIPFPVEQLFERELPHFRLLVLQNFSLLRFLMPEHQRRLVEFVKNGGGLLFVGGPRALVADELTYSPLAEILPFDVDAVRRRAGQGESYEPERELWLHGRDLDPAQQVLVGFYPQWQRLLPWLSQAAGWRGIHRVMVSDLKAEGHTPLLWSPGPEGEQRLVAAASYPGKGRALWLFTDQTWRLNLEQQRGMTRHVYEHFYSTALGWLLRHEDRTAWHLESAVLRQPRDEAAGFDLGLVMAGPAATYFAPEHASLTVCGREVKSAAWLLRPLGPNRLEVTARVGGRPGTQGCEVEFGFRAPAVGYQVARGIALLEPWVADRELDAKPEDAAALAQRYGSALIEGTRLGLESEVRRWVERHIARPPASLPLSHQEVEDPFWVLRRLLLWSALVAGLPLEVLVRRWDVYRRLRWSKRRK